MKNQNPDKADDTLEEIDEAFEVAPLSPQGDDDGLDEDEKETDGNVPVANLE